MNGFAKPARLTRSALAAASALLAIVAVATACGGGGSGSNNTGYGTSAAAQAFSSSQLASLPRTNWITNGGTISNQRYSPLTQISPLPGRHRRNPSACSIMRA